MKRPIQRGELATLRAFSEGIGRRRRGPLPMTDTPRCPICRGFLYVCMGRRAPEFRCLCPRVQPA